MKDSEPYDLIVAQNVAAPAPLDPAIASVILRTKSNRLAEGYDLSLSTFFGSERVRLVGGDFTASVKISIDRAQVDLQFVRSSASLIDRTPSDLSDERTVSETLLTRRANTRGANMLLGASTTNAKVGKADATLQLETEKSGITELEIRRNRCNWQRISSETILIGTASGELDGMEIDDFEGWRVIPNTLDGPSGVIATVSVREEWILSLIHI